MQFGEVSWQAPEADRSPRSTKWYMWTIAFGLLCIGISLYEGNLLFGIFVIIAGIVLFLLGNTKPRMHVYSANDNGIFIGGEALRERAELAAFAFHDSGSRYVELVLRPRDKFHTYSRVLVPRERAEDVANLLSNYLDQFEYEGGMKDVINKHLGI